MHSINIDVTAVSKIEAVQKILEVVCRTTGMGFSAVARVTPDKWIACAVRDEIAFGLKPGGELEIKTTICDEIRDSGVAVVINHVENDARFCTHHTPKRYGFQSYISVPINLPDGKFFGTLCAIDPKPADVNRPQIIAMFNLFAELIAVHLETQDRLSQSESALSTERETAKLREQFIAVLGHDLRSPLAAVVNGAQILNSTPLPEHARDVTAIIQRSAKRAIGLVSDLMDMAKDRMGDGFTFNRVMEANLAATLLQIVNEFRTAAPKREIAMSFVDIGSVYCDPSRIGQMLSNLISNALAYGDRTSPVLVSAKVDMQYFELAVTNYGTTIPDDVKEKLFEPFTRGAEHAVKEGLGLGLYIASQIAKGHNGELSVQSVNGQTTFLFRMPSEFGSITN